MAEFVNTLNALPALPAWIKAGWALLFAWSLAQMLWYRRARRAAPVQQASPPQMPPRRPEPRTDRPVQAVAPLPSHHAATPGSVLGLT